MYRLLIRPFLFLLDAENAHSFASAFLRLMGLPGVRHLIRLLNGNKSPDGGIDLMGLHFPSRLGLAAGFDKNAQMYRGLFALGFGFVEIGTVTPIQQDGNPRKRLFRLKKDKALINRMGFNNDGIEIIRRRLENRKVDTVVGGNIGKNKLTPNDRAVEDYVMCFEELYPYVDYFTVNVSSPNTPGLRELQEKKHLLTILGEVMKRNKAKANPKPVLLKLSPDLTTSQLDDVVEIVGLTGIAGVIATNTTISRENLISPSSLVDAIGQGGLSGQPLRKKSLDIVSYLSKKCGKSFVIIGCGGIFSPNDARDFLDAGADLIQIYSGFIYEGPSLVSRINKELLKYGKP